MSVLMSVDWQWYRVLATLCW